MSTLLTLLAPKAHNYCLAGLLQVAPIGRIRRQVKYFFARISCSPLFVLFLFWLALIVAQVDFSSHLIGYPHLPKGFSSLLAFTAYPLALSRCHWATAHHHFRCSLVVFVLPILSFQVVGESVISGVEPFRVCFRRERRLLFASRENIDLIWNRPLVQVLYLSFLPKHWFPVFTDSLYLFDALKMALLQHLLSSLIISPYKRVHLNTIINSSVRLTSIQVIWLILSY